MVIMLISRCWRQPRTHSRSTRSSRANAIRAGRSDHRTAPHRSRPHVRGTALPSRTRRISTSVAQLRNELLKPCTICRQSPSGAATSPTTCSSAASSDGRSTPAASFGALRLWPLVPLLGEFLVHDPSLGFGGKHFILNVAKIVVAPPSFTPSDAKPMVGAAVHLLARHLILDGHDDLILQRDRPALLASPVDAIRIVAGL